MRVGRPHSGRLAGKIALITGASRGIGAAVALRFAGEGAHVVLTARTVGGLEELDDAIRARGGSATLVPARPARFRQRSTNWRRRSTNAIGRLDILVGNAGEFGMFSPLAHISPSMWAEIIDLNLTANWRLIRAMDPLLRAAPAGRAIFVTSGRGTRHLRLLGALRSQQGRPRNAGQDLCRRGRQDRGARESDRSRRRAHPAADPRLPRRGPEPPAAARERRPTRSSTSPCRNAPSMANSSPQGEIWNRIRLGCSSHPAFQKRQAGVEQAPTRRRLAVGGHPVNQLGQMLGDQGQHLLDRQAGLAGDLLDQLAT